MSLEWEISSIRKKKPTVLQGLRSKAEKCFVTKKSTVKLFCYVASLLCISTETGGCFTWFNVSWLDSVPYVSEGYYSSVLCPVFSLGT